MAKHVVIDHDILNQATSLSDNLRNVMLLCRELRSDFEIDRDVIKLIEGMLFVISVDLAALNKRVGIRLGEYATLASAAIEAVEDLTLDDPGALVPANVIVCTGSYRPRAANDAVLGVLA